MPYPSARLCAVLCLALAPTVFVSLSRNNHPLAYRDPTTTRLGLLVTDAHERSRRSVSEREYGPFILQLKSQTRELFDVC